MQGVVIKSTGSWYVVKSAEGKWVQCKIKGNFRLKNIRSTNPVAVGDRVIITENSDGTAYITEIEERKNYIVRKSINLSKQSHILAANLDQCFLLVTLIHPETSPIFIDRFLASAEAYRIPVTLVFNKTDLLDKQGENLLQEFVSLYSAIGYGCIALSAETGKGMEALLPLVQGKTTLLSGHSGVGKSTLINALIPGLNIRTGNLSEYYDKGTHTTTFTEMFEVAPESYLIDSPGIKGFGSFNMKEEEMSHYFTDIFRYSQGCRYGNCTHTHEPDCAVREAVEQGKIARSRYLSYLNMLEDEHEEKYRTPF